jgi:hypothetical protein
MVLHFIGTLSELYYCEVEYMKKIFTREIKIVLIVTVAVIVSVVSGAILYNNLSKGSVPAGSISSSGTSSVQPQTLGTMPADNPTPPGDKFAPPAVKKSVDTAPVISGITAQAGPDRSIIIQGEGFTKDTTGQKVWVYTQTTNTNKSLYLAKVTACNEATITAVMDASKPYSMFMVYVENKNGISAPVYVNEAKIWWIGKTLAQAGEENSIYGDNLSYQNGTEKSYVYLRPVGANSSVKSIPAEVKKANPYKVTFVVPKGTKAGQEYEVWLHNGHGGNLGWVVAPQNLKISNSQTLVWNNVKHNVTKFGADAGDATNDDSAAIQAAIDAAKDGDTIYFPAGTYKVSKEIVSSKVGLHFLGEGSDKSVVVMDPGYKGKTPLFMITAFPFQMDSIGFKDIRSDPNPPLFFSIKGDAFPVDIPNVVIEKCRFEQTNKVYTTPLARCIEISSVYNLYIQNCAFEVPGAVIGQNCTKSFINNNTIIGNFLIGEYDGPNMIHFNNSKMIDVSDNQFTGKDKFTDPNGELNAGDFCINRSVVFGEADSEIYVATNDIQRSGNPVTNCGEQIMFESPYTQFIGKASTITEDKLTFTNDKFQTPTKGSVVTILNGKGEAQYRRVRSAKGNTVTLDKPWDIIPDSNSLFGITRPFENVVVYANKIDGFKNFADIPNAGCGIQAYGNLINFFVAKNEFSNYMYGVLLTSHYYDGFIDQNPNQLSNHFAWNIVDDNIITNVRIGISAMLVYEGTTNNTPIPQHSIFNTMIRGNTIKNAVFSTNQLLTGIGGNAINVGTQKRAYTLWPESSTWNGDWIRNTVIEANTFNGSEGAPILLQKHQGFTVLRKNTFLGNNADKPVQYETYAAQAILVDGKP